MLRWLRAAFPNEEIIPRYTSEDLAPYELDAYLPNLKPALAVEYHGEQHVADIGFRDERKQRERDRRKAQRCDELGIRLVVIYACDLTRSHIERLFDCKLPETPEIQELEHASRKYQNGLIRCGNVSARRSFRETIGWPPPPTPPEHARQRHQRRQ